MTKRTPPYSPEVRERAVRMVFEHRNEYASQYEAILSIAAKIGCSRETLRHWVRQAERDQGLRPGPTSAEQEKIKALEREVRELRQANEILRKASAYFAQAELDRRFKPGRPLSTSIVRSTGSSRSAVFCRSPRRPTMSTPPARPIPTADRPASAGTPTSARRSAGSLWPTSASMGSARSGARCSAKGSRWRAARSPG